jgi:hypothetical protein
MPVGVKDGCLREGVIQRALPVAVLLKRLEIEDIESTKIMFDSFDVTGKLAEVLKA